MCIAIIAVCASTLALADVATAASEVERGFIQQATKKATPDNKNNTSKGGRQDAPVITSRSNKKHGNLSADTGNGQQKAAINTSRSNKKHSQK
ncbi:MAG TPA: hypothetical protein VK512_02975 [Xanthobacteraceae bacterium]|nr:hypothetical protein [Xanthobacteraceae bacterium]